MTYKLCSTKGLGQGHCFALSFCLPYNKLTIPWHLWFQTWHSLLMHSCLGPTDLYRRKDETEVEKRLGSTQLLSESYSFYLIVVHDFPICHAISTYNLIRGLGPWRIYRKKDFCAFVRKLQTWEIKISQIWTISGLQGKDHHQNNFQIQCEVKMKHPYVKKLEQQNGNDQRLQNLTIPLKTKNIASSFSI